MDLRCVSAVLSTHPVWFWVQSLSGGKADGRTDTDRFSRARSVGGKYRIGKKIGSGSVSLSNLYLSRVYTKRN